MRKIIDKGNLLKAFKYSDEYSNSENESVNENVSE